MVNIFRIDIGTRFVHVGLLFRFKSRGTMLQCFSHIRLSLVVYWYWVNFRKLDLGYAWTDMDYSHSDRSHVRIWIEISSQFQENAFGIEPGRLTTINYICDKKVSYLLLAFLNKRGLFFNNDKSLFI